VARYYYTEENPAPDDLHVEGVVLLNDLESFSDLEGCRVIVFQDTRDGEVAIEEIKETGELEVAFQAALSGDAEELSIAKLVKFYLANGM
jgi:hypothetical protein